jgi:ribonucleoside-diphosphate reductase alpha chain
MKITRQFTTAGQDVFAQVKWTTRDSRITNSDGSVVFEMKDAEVPEGWSQLATDIMVSKYFRKAGVPQFNPETGAVRVDEKGTVITGPETSARQVIHRLAGCWRHWGEAHGYFDTPEDAQAFYDELCHMMLHQMAAPNSPQWFNTGLNWAYGITGPAQGHWIADPRNGEVKQASDAYTHPQPHACFIQSVNDDLVNEGGIMDLWTREARLFKYGSGTGTNFSSLRGENERLSGGGKSSGLMSFLKIGDRAAGAIKSGGTTRRAAKMVCLDADHPDIEQFVNWKVREELKVAAMVEGMKHLPADQQELARTLNLELTYDFNGEAYQTVSGQNSNNSVRLSNDFFKAIDDDADWPLFGRTEDKVVRTIKSRGLWEQICFAAWRCADPGLQYDTTINAWHTCPASGRINASNPCSEYMFLDNTACNLASLNLLKFYEAEAREFDIAKYEHAIRLWTVVLEISVLMASFPSREIAEQSWRFRTLGLGYANLGAMLMQAGIPYDSPAGRAICGALTAMLTGRSYATSAEMAAELGAFAEFTKNRAPMLRVIRNHRRAAHGVARKSGEYEELDVAPVPIDHDLYRRHDVHIANADEILLAATKSWDDALHLGEKHGYRNAQVTVIAPTGTIGLLMDCDTTGVEPDFALTKFKKLAGGGYFKIANRSLRPALKTLGYRQEQIDDMLRYVMGTLSVDTPMPASACDQGDTLREFLTNNGYETEDLIELENALPTVFELRFGFNAWSMPKQVLEALGINIDAARKDPSFDGLKLLGLSPAQIEELNLAVCGTQTVEGAPHLKAEHLPVFDCASTCGKLGTRFISTEGHIRMMAASQPFISGAISKTINLPNHATVADIASSYRLSWELGLKANALYRDGCKLSQPLATRSDSEASKDEVEAKVVEEALGKSSTRSAETSAMPTLSTSCESVDVEVATVERVVERIVERPLRRRLADTRRSLTHRFNVGGHEGYLTVGLYDNGSPGELFITMSKEGSTIGGLMDSLGTAISVALQYGVPIESLVNKFAHQRFEPMGMTTNKDIPFAKSLVDYIFRWLGMQFIPGYRDANAPKRGPERPAEDWSRRNVKEDRAWMDGDRNLPNEPSERRATNAATTPSVAVANGATSNGSSNGNGEVTGTGKTDGRSPSSNARHSSTASLAIVETQSVSRSDGSESMTASGVKVMAVVSALDQSNASLMNDAPMCDVCGSITVRNGACYKCMNCGNSLGCS